MEFWPEGASVGGGKSRGTILMMMEMMDNTEQRNA